jgi:hypothetical protein
MRSGEWGRFTVMRAYEKQSVMRLVALGAVYNMEKVVLIR